MGTIVQHKSGSAVVVAIHNSTTPNLACTVAFDLPVTAHNTLILIPCVGCNSGLNTGPGSPTATSAQSIFDNRGNVWAQAKWVNGGVQIQGVGAFYVKDALPGNTLISFSLSIQNSNPIFDLGNVISMIIIEYHGLGVNPTLALPVPFQQNTAGIAAMNLTLTDSQSTTVTSGYGSSSQQSGIVIDLSAGGLDLFLAANTGNLNNALIPGNLTVSPLGYFSYTLVDTAVNGPTNTLNVWTGETFVPPTPVSIICDNPPVGQVAVAYSHAFPASGGTPPYTFSITAGALPTGLALDPATGIVSGVPTVAGTYAFTVQATDLLSVTAHVNCSILINPVFNITCGNPPDGTVGVFYSHLFPVSGGIPPYVFSISGGALPPGLTLNSGTGVISGTPTAAGTYSFSVQVQDQHGAILHCNITIIVFLPAPLRLTYCDAALFFDYPDTDSVQHTFEIDTNGGFWPHQYPADPVIVHYWEETTAGLPESIGVPTRMLMGTSDGYVLQAGGNTDQGVPFKGAIRTPSYDFDDPRVLKLFMDMMTDVDPTGGYDLNVGFNNYALSTLIGTQPPDPMAGRVQYLNSISSPLANGLIMYRNMAAEYAIGAGTVLYEFEPSFYLQPFYSSFYTTQLMDHGLPGWKQLRFGRIAVISVSNVVVQILNDDGVTIATLTLPSTAGVLKNYYVQLPHAGKGRLLRYTASSGSEFVLFVDKTYIRMKKWGGPQFLEVRPFLQ